MLCQMAVSHADFGLGLLREHLAENDVCFRRLLVPEHARRRGVATRVELLAEQLAWQDGARYIWGFIHEGNTPSRKLHAKLGYVECGRIDLVTWFGRKYAKVRIEGDRRPRTIRLPDSVSKL
jgi:RimJ/RimL family protein N-acetyltransferase